VSKTHKEERRESERKRERAGRSSYALSLSTLITRRADQRRARKNTRRTVLYVAHEPYPPSKFATVSALAQSRYSGSASTAEIAEAAMKLFMLLRRGRKFVYWLCVVVMVIERGV